MLSRRPLMLALIALLLLGLLAYFGTRTWMEYRMAGVVDRQLALLPGQMDVRYDGIRVKLFQRTLRLEGVRISLSPDEPAIYLQALVLHRIDRDNPIPHEVEIEVRGFDQRLAGSRLPLADMLQAHGYDRLRGSAYLHYRYVPEERRLELPRLRLTLHELGELVTEGRWPQHRPAGLPLMDWRVVDSLALDFLELSYQDEGLVPRILQRSAYEQGMLSTSLASNIVAEMEWSAADFSDERLDASVRALRLFLLDPQVLIRLRLDPEEPKPLGELRDLVLVDPPRAALELRLLLSTPAAGR